MIWYIPKKDENKVKEVWKETRKVINNGIKLQQKLSHDREKRLIFVYENIHNAKIYNENVITNEQGELFLAEKTFSVMSLFEQNEMMSRMLFEISGHRKDISLVHVEQMLALMANKEGKQQNCPYGVLAKRVRDGLLLMK